MATKKAAPAKKGSGTSVQKASSKSTALATNDMKSMFLQDAGQGLENATAADYALPFIYLLQDLSPQVKKREDSYVEGAEPGMFINTVTNELMEEVLLIPVEFEKVYNEWVPRDEGGGFVASYRDKNEAEMNKREDTQIVDTANHYCLFQNSDGQWTPAIVSLTSSKMKASRNWLSRISQVLIQGPRGKVVAPSFSRKYVMSAVPAKNDKGSFFVPKIEPVEGEEGWVSDMELYEQAKDFRVQLKAGQKGVDYSKTAEAELVEEDDDGAEY